MQLLLWSPHDWDSCGFSTASIVFVVFVFIFSRCFASVHIRIGGRPCATSKQQNREASPEEWKWKGAALVLLGVRPSLLGWRPPLVGWRPSLLGWRPSLFKWFWVWTTWNSCPVHRPRTSGSNARLGHLAPPMTSTDRGRGYRKQAYTCSQRVPRRSQPRVWVPICALVCVVAQVASPK